jgi:hypothetical protein
MNNPPNATDQCISCSGTGLKSIQTESGKYEPCYCVYGLARAAYANEWFPGADGVESVEQMWRFYLARGDTITQLRAELEAVRKERDSRKKWADVAEGDIEEARALFVKAGALESYDGDYSPSCLLECAEQIIQERDAATAALSQARGEWVSVKDRMPTEIDSVVLIARRSPSFGMKVESARYTADAFIGASAWWHHESYVTHWRPLPHPPETSTASGV